MTNRYDDPIDRALLARLELNARESAAELARHLGLARTTVLARMARLEREGVITGYTIRRGPALQEAGVAAYVGITVEPKQGRNVEKALARMPELRQLSTVSGEYDFLAYILAESTAKLDQLLDEIGSLEGVRRTHTSVVLARRIERS